jgi:EPS-associated MarR family transcriptional regulator
LSLVSPLQKLAGFQEEIQFEVLRRLHQTPQVSQRALAKDLGVGFGTINSCFQALVEKGLLKMQYLSQSKNKLRYAYLLTPAGAAEKSKLTAACRPPACASSPSMARGAGRTWRCSNSPRPSLPARRSRSSIMASTGGDFTYIDDIVEGVIRVLDHPAQPNPTRTGTALSWTPASAKHPGGSTILATTARELMDYIAALERALGRKAEMDMLSLQPGDVPDTYADVPDLVEQFHYKLATPV